MTNQRIKSIAKDQVKTSFGEIFVGILIVNVIISVASSWTIGLAALIIGGPMYVGLFYYLLIIARGQNSKFEDLFMGFKQFIRNMLGSLLVSIYVLLWSFLLIIPGIIKAFSYSMVFYIMADDPNISVDDAISLSRKIMDGNKMKLFELRISFIGWMLLGIFTFGLLYIWLIPYMQMAEVNFYEDLISKITPKDDDFVETAY